VTYDEFTFDLLGSRFGVSVVDAPGLFADTPPLPPSAFFREQLARNLPLVSGVDTEKVRSELLIAPLLVELRELCGRQIGVFSGAGFTVDAARGLDGFCDFLLSRAPTLLQVAAPVVAIVEAKRESLTNGVPLCVAELFAAQLFNTRREQPITPVYGVVTTGTAWRFLRMTGTVAEVDIEDRFIDNPDAILGVLARMVSVPGSPTAPRGSIRAHQREGNLEDNTHATEPFLYADQTRPVEDDRA